GELHLREPAHLQELGDADEPPDDPHGKRDQPARRIDDQLRIDEPHFPPEHPDRTLSCCADVLDPMHIGAVREEEHVPIAAAEHVDGRSIGSAGPPPTVRPHTEERQPGGDQPTDRIQRDDDREQEGHPGPGHHRAPLVSPAPGRIGWSSNTGRPRTASSGLSTSILSTVRTNHPPRRDRRARGAMTVRTNSAASPDPSSTAITVSDLRPTERVARPAARRLRTQWTSPKGLMSPRLPPNSQSVTGVVRGRPLRRPRTVRRTSGPIGTPAARSRRATTLKYGTHRGTRRGMPTRHRPDDAVLQSLLVPPEL